MKEFGFRRSKIIHNGIEVFSVVPDLGAAATTLTTVHIKLEYLIFIKQWTKSWKNWYLIYDYSVYSVNDLDNVCEFTVLNKSGMIYAVKSSQDSVEMELMPSSHSHCKISINHSKYSWYEVDREDLFYLDLKNHVERGKFQHQPPTDSFFVTNKATLDTFPAKPEFPLIPAALKLDLKTNVLHKISARHEITRSINHSRFFGKPSKTTIGESFVSRFVFFHESTHIPISDSGGSDYPIFGTLKLFSPNELQDGGVDGAAEGVSSVLVVGEEELSDAEYIKIVGATFGSWLNDVLHPLAPFNSRDTQRSL
ncbi:hypothetical protein HK100_011132 [Physocladia obscura]|uniref:Uncharacterized protein n=1 Tax=Physocladia obscura TaxID=109957 RepID=A0AAD5XDH0_9FUNG|nr:hypothetical protein HK100_011132 [Physocladia obscura]